MLLCSTPACADDEAAHEKGEFGNCSLKAARVIFSLRPCASLPGHLGSQHGTRPLQPIARLGTTGAETAAATEELTVTSGAAAGAGAGAETGSRESARREQQS